MTENIKKGIHPQKFAMWTAIGSMIMMFGGFTSGYVVRRAQGNWDIFDLPVLFWISTGVILLSSLTMYLSVKTLKNEKLKQHKNFVSITVILGITFGVLQFFGFLELYQNNIKMSGNPSGSFLFVIAGAHLLHVLGGVVALIVQYFKSNRYAVSSAIDTSGIEIVATFWHFVDILWLYLFVFFIFFR